LISCAYLGELHIISTNNIVNHYTTINFTITDSSYFVIESLVW